MTLVFVHTSLLISRNLFIVKLSLLSEVDLWHVLLFSFTLLPIYISRIYLSHMFYLFSFKILLQHFDTYYFDYNVCLFDKTFYLTLLFWLVPAKVLIPWELSLKYHHVTSVSSLNDFTANYKHYRCFVV